jgi:hypothetical protein
MQDNNVTYGKEVNSGVVQEINIFDQRVVKICHQHFMVCKFPNRPFCKSEGAGVSFEQRCQFINGGLYSAKAQFIKHTCPIRKRHALKR